MCHSAQTNTYSQHLSGTEILLKIRNQIKMTNVCVSLKVMLKPNTKKLVFVEEPLGGA